MEQMLALMAEPPEIVEAAHPGRPAAGEGPRRGARLRGRHLPPRRARRSAWTDVSFTAEPGTTTALVGPSGAGKTTIVRLALRLLDPDDGPVTLDGVDLREVAHGGPAPAIALVPQDVALFNDTLRANIAFAAPRRAGGRGLGAPLEAAELGRLRPRPARGPGDPGRRAGPQALRRRAPAGRHRPRPAGQPAPADPRRGHQRPGRPHRGGDPGDPAQGRAPAAPPWWSPTASPPSPTPTRSW